MLRIDALELESKNYERKVRYANETSKDQLIGSAKLLNDSNSFLLNSKLTVDNIRNTIYEVQKLADSFDAFESTKVEAAIAEANRLFDDLKEISLDTTPSENQLATTSNYLADVEKFSEPVNQQQKQLDNLRLGIGNFSNKLDDLHNWSVKANQQSAEAENLHLKNKNSAVNSKFGTVTNHGKEARNNTESVQNLGKNVEVTLGEIFRHLGSLENVNNELKTINAQVDKELPLKNDEYETLDAIIDQANEHRNQLAASV